MQFFCFGKLEIIQNCYQNDALFFDCEKFQHIWSFIYLFAFMELMEREIL